MHTGTDFLIGYGREGAVLWGTTPCLCLCLGDRLAASYINFYIANSAVIVPGFDDPNDDVAKQIVCGPCGCFAGVSQCSHWLIEEVREKEDAESYVCST